MSHYVYTYRLTNAKTVNSYSTNTGRITFIIRSCDHEQKLRVEAREAKIQQTYQNLTSTKSYCLWSLVHTIKVVHKVTNSQGRAALTCRDNDCACVRGRKKQELAKFQR